MGTKFIVRVCYAEGRERVKFTNGVSAVEYAKYCVRQSDVKKIELKDCATGDKEIWRKDSNGNTYISVGF